jgi:hypothetical protein
MPKTWTASWSQMGIGFWIWVLSFRFRQILVLCEVDGKQRVRHAFTNIANNCSSKIVQEPTFLVIWRACDIGDFPC